MAQATSPPSTIARNAPWRSIASGVVRTPVSSRPATTVLIVPSSPQGRPAASSSPRTRKAVVVLPFVPVMPTTSSSAVGSPWKRAAAGAIAARALSTRTSGTPRPSGRSTTSAAAPRSTAAGAKSWPSAVNPGTQKKRNPGSTLRLSNASPRISGSGPPAASGRSEESRTGRSAVRDPRDVAVVEHERVPVRVLEERHVADAGVEDVALELEPAGLEVRARLGHVLHVQGDVRLDGLVGQPHGLRRDHAEG